jgi:hypothetical protein
VSQTHVIYGMRLRGALRHCLLLHVSRAVTAGEKGTRITGFQQSPALEAAVQQYRLGAVGVVPPRLRAAKRYC